MSFAFTVRAEQTIWTGTGDWATSVANWSAGVPEAGDDVLIANGSVLLTNDTLLLGSFTMTNGTFTFSNLAAVVRATNVWITRGTVTHVTNSATATNASGEWPIDGRVYFVCTNFFLQSPGTINVKMRGWRSGSAGGYGPGGGGDIRAGAGYGGLGGNASDAGGVRYGTFDAPAYPGSGGGPAAADGYNGGTGGGLVIIDAAGNVTINGTINANANNLTSDGTIRGGGSGGGIWISCAGFAATNGILQAIGGQCGYPTGNSGGGGGGGRIAIRYNQTVQSNLPPSTVTIKASRGPLAGVGYLGDIGTIYLPDVQLLPTNISFVEGQVLGPTKFAPGDLLISNVWVRFGQAGFALAVTNNITVDGSDGLLEIGGTAVVARSRGCFLMYSEEMNGSGGTPFGRTYYNAATSVMTCGGNLVLTNGGDMRVFSGPTNNTQDFGMLVDVTGDAYLNSGSWIYPVSNPTNGGSVLFRMRNLAIPAANAGFNANQGGYGGGGGSQQNGYGPGGAGSASGGGYGGTGGVGVAVGGSVYGSSNAPINPGSGGGRGGATTDAAHSGGAGGGLIRLEITDNLTLAGKLLANGRLGLGGDTGNPQPGAGAGGGIYIQCRSLEGAGIMEAKGGTNFIAGNAGTGGGGRIAVIGPPTNLFTGTMSVDPGLIGAASALGTTGTIVWITTFIPSGTLFAFE